MTCIELTPTAAVRACKVPPNVKSAESGIRRSADVAPERGTVGKYPVNSALCT